MDCLVQAGDNVPRVQNVTENICAIAIWHWVENEDEWRHRCARFDGALINIIDAAQEGCAIVCCTHGLNPW